MSSEVKANKLSPATGTALQISDSGDTTTIPSGATLAIASGATIANSGTQTGFGLFTSYAIIADQKTQNTAGGTFTLGSWQTHDLQTEVADPDGIVSIATNQFTLAAGTYFLRWAILIYDTGRTQTRIYNVTDTSEVGIGLGAEARYGSSYTGSCRTTIAGAKAFRLEAQCSVTRATTGWGYAANFGTEQYCYIEIFKEA